MDQSLSCSTPGLSASHTKGKQQTLWNEVAQLNWKVKCKELIINHNYSLKFNDPQCSFIKEGKKTTSIHIVNPDYMLL
jgi:hypothetical protein